MRIVDPPYLEGPQVRRPSLRNNALHARSNRRSNRYSRISGNIRNIIRWSFCRLITLGIIVSADDLRTITHYPDSHQTALDSDAPRSSSCVSDNIPFDTDVVWDDYAMKYNGLLEYALSV